jgi:gliding motility-associated transport system permease protein
LKSILSVVRKEMRSYFNSPIAYIVIVFFLVFTATWLFYVARFVAQDIASLRAYFGIMPLVFVGLVPALTMRSWAEESKLGTEEILLTLPYRESELVLGKFFGAYGLLVLVILLTVFVPFSVTSLGNFERGEIFGEYLGILLLGAAATSIGLFVSSVTKNQISAFILSAVALLFLTLINQVNAVVDLPTWLASVINYVSLQFHIQSFIRGVIDTRDVVYFLAITVLFLYLNVKTLVFRKWS